MHRSSWLQRSRLSAVAPVMLIAALAAPAAAQAHGYRQTNLVSDQPGVAQLTDPNLVNPWGLAAGPTTPLWAADNGTGVASIYAGAVGGMPIARGHPVAAHRDPVDRDVEAVRIDLTRRAADGHGDAAPVRVATMSGRLDQ